jgi:hypothetical protein
LEKRQFPRVFELFVIAHPAETFSAACQASAGLARKFYMRKPNFFIIGAPKCGTTSLAYYLMAHPNVFIPELKELNFFNTDMSYRKVRCEADYFDYFRDAHAQHSAVGEASVTYLYSDRAVPNIIDLIPEARLVVMVRNPIDMATSLHAHLCHDGNENIPDFRAAWRKQESRRNGIDIPRFCNEPSFLMYGEVCSVGRQLKRLYDRVPREKVLVLFQDDLKTDARATYLRTLEFLELPDDGRTDFDAYNTRFPGIRSRFIQVILRSISDLNLSSGIERKLGVLRFIQALNSRRAENQVLGAEFRAELADYFRNDVENLSELVGRDLSGWLRA